MPKKEEQSEERKKEAIRKAAESVEAAIEKLDKADEDEEDVVGEKVIEIREEEKEEAEIEITHNDGQEEKEEEEVSVDTSDNEPQSKDVTDEKKADVSQGISDVGTTFTRSSYQEEKNPSGSKSKLIITICLIIIFTLIGFVGGYFYGKSVSSNNTVTPSSEIETIPTFTPTPTEEEVDLSAYSIEILNGSGVAGVAGDEQDALVADGFSVENTGNAENQDFTETMISVKSSVPAEFIQKLRDSLSERYVVTSGTEDLEDDNDYDVVITIGSETVVDE